MFVLGELEKSVKALKEVADKLKAIDTIIELDTYEVSTQKLVFNLQMQANQVAGELVPLMSAKRIELQNGNAQRALERVRAAQNKVAQTVKPKVEDDGNSNRQQQSKAGNGKSKSSSKTK